MPAGARQLRAGGRRRPARRAAPQELSEALRRGDEPGSPARRGEQEYAVPGLPTPPDRRRLSALELARLPADGRAADPETLGQYEAVRLFIARAVAVRPDFRVTNENAPAVAGICAMLQGLPLAIELAAARVKLLGPDAILERLGNHLEVLASSSHDLPERQRTLRGAIAWSYDLLDDAGRRLLARLSVFVGGVTSR